MIDNLIYTIAKKNGASNSVAKLIIAQAKFETANFTSNAFKKCKNLFGYKFVGQRKYSDESCIRAPKSEGGVYAKYDNIEKSVLELLSWLKRRNINIQNEFSPVTYAAALKKFRYYGISSESYAKGLQHYLINTSPKMMGFDVSTLIIAGIIFYYLKKR